jgi:hypothetical protein
MEFHSKYLKYKLKYLQLKELIGGATTPTDRIVSSITNLPSDNWSKMSTNGFGLGTKMKNPLLGTVEEISKKINAKPNWWLNEGIDEKLHITPVGKLMIIDVIKPKIPGLTYKNTSGVEIYGYDKLKEAIKKELSGSIEEINKKYTEIQEKADAVNQKDEILHFLTTDILNKDFKSITREEDFERIWGALGEKKIGNKLKLILYEISNNNDSIKTSGKFKKVGKNDNFQAFLNKKITNQEQYELLKK